MNCTNKMLLGIVLALQVGIATAASSSGKQVVGTRSGQKHLYISAQDHALAELMRDVRAQEVWQQEEQALVDGVSTKHGIILSPDGFWPDYMACEQDKSVIARIKMFVASLLNR